jgi:type II secretory ATPase GspE/PulE/Tfp pilus assembly ATPase PilB-like protein
LTITSRPHQISFDYLPADGVRREFSLPKKLEQNFIGNLRQILAVAPQELIVKKYCRLNDRQGRLAFYLTILPDGQGEKIIININNRENDIWRLNQLGLQTADRHALQKAICGRSGLIIVSSPPDGGKSTTLRSLLAELNDPRLNIYFLSENLPIELPGINLLANRPANWDKIIRHDCEIIAVDDLDEAGSLEKALRAAASGRLVLGTMTGDDSFEILNKLLAVNLPLKLKLDGLKMIASQRLADLKRSGTKKNQRQKIALFEILSLNADLKKFLSETNSDETREFAAALEKIALTSGFRPWTTDRRQKIKDGLLV